MILSRFYVMSRMKSGITSFLFVRILSSFGWNLARIYSNVVSHFIGEICFTSSNTSTPTSLIGFSSGHYSKPRSITYGEKGTEGSTTKYTTPYSISPSPLMTKLLETVSTPFTIFPRLCFHK